MYPPCSGLKLMRSNVFKFTAQSFNSKTLLRMNFRLVHGGHKSPRQQPRLPNNDDKKLQVGMNQKSSSL